MAISPPSDIVLDVARAVDPTQMETARAALMKKAGAAASFAADASSDPSPTTGKVKADPATQYKRFEAMVLQTFIQNMLPKDSEDVYGKGFAGDMWKSQLAQHLADVMADRGGIGIAKSMLAEHYMKGDKKVPVGQISNTPEQARVDQQTGLSASLLHQLQMRVTHTMRSDEPAQTERKA
jgi:Rod binding domain-containing protein